MPSKREMLEEILKKLESVELAQLEMSASIRELQSTQLNKKPSIGEIEKSQIELNDPTIDVQKSQHLETTPTFESQNIIIPTKYENHTSKLNENTILELQIVINELKKSILEINTSQQNIHTTLLELQEHQNQPVTIQEQESSTTIKIQEFGEVRSSIAELKTSLSGIKETMDELQTSHQMMHTNIEDVKASHYDLKATITESTVLNNDFNINQLDTHEIDELKATITELQNSLFEVKNSLFDLQASQKTVSLTVQELQNVYSDLHASNIDLNNTIFEFNSSQNDLKEKLTDIQTSQKTMQDSIDLVQVDFGPITNQVEKYSDRINMLKNYVDKLHEDILKLFEEMETIKKHSIKNSTLLTPLNNIVPKLLQIESDMNILKKQLEANSINATHDRLVKNLNL
ncbi:hypothetical protein MTP04_20710 [Lysinibacillus sp. PLM2]|nr:hypothetical protein MTP04_20710 [Lysinibacillus sp. PLM2]